MNDMCLSRPLTAKLPINFIILAKYPPFFLGEPIFMLNFAEYIWFV